MPRNRRSGRCWTAEHLPEKEAVLTAKPEVSDCAIAGGPRNNPRHVTRFSGVTPVTLSIAGLHPATNHPTGVP